MRGSFVRCSLALLLAACQGPAPSRIQVELPEVILSKAPVRVLVWQWDDKNQRSEAKQGLDLSVQPAELAKVDGGFVTCTSSGDGTVTASVSGVTSTGALHCRMVDRLEAPTDLGRIELTKGPLRLDIGAYDKGGNELEGVPVKITTKNTQIARAEGEQLVPLKVGSAKVEVRAGDIGREFSVDIVKRLTPEPIPIDKDRRLHFTLEPGRYELNIELEREAKLSTEWLGAPYCNSSSVAKVHTTQCLLQKRGGVAFDNPAYLNSGATTASHDGITLLLIEEQ